MFFIVSMSLNVIIWLMILAHQNNINDLYITLLYYYYYYYYVINLKLTGYWLDSYIGLNQLLYLCM